MKLSVWAKNNGIDYQTAYRWFREGVLPCKAEQLSTGTILVQDSVKPVDDNVVIYSRVSSYDRRDCLNGQIDRCTQFANAKGLAVNKVFKEIASGMNDKRQQLMKLLDSKPTHIIVEHKDRLTRFGFNYLEKLLNQQGCQILVLNRDLTDETDLIKDMISIVTSFCCRLYGMRRGKNKARLMRDVINSND